MKGYKNKYWDFYDALLDGFKVPRKVKKFLLGKKLNRSKITKKIKTTIGIIHNGNYEVDIINGEFCLKCGCKLIKTENYPVEYPEVYYDCICVRCGNIVGGADNSVYYSELEDLINIKHCSDEKCPCHERI